MVTILLSRIHGVIAFYEDRNIVDTSLPNYGLCNPVWIPLLIAVWCDMEIIFYTGVGWGGGGSRSSPSIPLRISLEQK
jgi:hypothetical protein